MVFPKEWAFLWRHTPPQEKSPHFGRYFKIINHLGSFALWGGLFSMTDCALIHLRNKEDFLNPIAAGFFTGGFLAIRGSYPSYIISRRQSGSKKRYIWRHHLGNDSVGWGWNDQIPNEKGDGDDVEDVDRVAWNDEGANGYKISL